MALFHDRSTRKESAAAKNSVTLFEGKTIPRELADTLAKVNDDKAFPGTITIPNTAQDQWTTRALTRSLWKDGVPKYTLLWLSEPDKSQHDASPRFGQCARGYRPRPFSLEAISPNERRERHGLF